MTATKPVGPQTTGAAISDQQTEITSDYTDPDRRTQYLSLEEPVRHHQGREEDASAMGGRPEWVRIHRPSVPPNPLFEDVDEKQSVAIGGHRAPRDRTRLSSVL
jgi:hypothetical protein